MTELTTHELCMNFRLIIKTEAYLWWCDQHGHKLAGESPVTTLERRECIDKGKGARRNFPDLPEEGIPGDGKPMRDLKEA